MQIHKFTFNPFQENTYLVEHENVAFIIDPGCSSAMENQELDDLIEQNDIRIKAVLNTHCHIDHILGNAHCCRKYSAPLWMDSRDLPNLNMGPQVSQMYAIPYTPSPEPTEFLDDKAQVNLGNEELEIRFVPGHAPGHIVFIHHGTKSVIGGDTLFQLSIGRTDLPGGDHELLLSSIKEQLFSLPEDYTVYSGHGPETSIGFEKEHNPFVGKRASSF